jgi:hypothetical protein
LSSRPPSTAVDSQFDAFLFASLGQEDADMPLSVFSALARLGIDARAEAARLSVVPEAVAIEFLMPMIAGLSDSRVNPPDTLAAARHLVSLLPKRLGRVRHQQPRAASSGMLIWVVCCAIVAGIGILGLAANGELSFGKEPPAVSRSLVPPQVRP